MRWGRDERGQASVEVLLMLPLVLLVALIIWQVHLTLSVANDAENAARTASREGGGAEAARQALQPEYRDNITKCKGTSTECGIQVHGRHVQVYVDVPVIVPGGSDLGLGFHVKGEADMPEGL